MKRKIPIRLNSAEHEGLETLYLANRIPVDRYQNRPADLSKLSATFNAL